MVGRVDIGLGLMADVAIVMAWIAAGSAFGGVVRFFVSGLVARAVGETFPWGTMVVNVTGALTIGILSNLAESHTFLTRPEAWPLAVTGFLGSYTTVSSFSLQTLVLVRDGEWWRAMSNILLSLLLCLSAVVAGVAAGGAISVEAQP